MKRLLIFLFFISFYGNSQTNLKLGEYVSFKNSPEAKGIDIGFKEPLGWTKTENSFYSDNENLVATYINVEMVSMVQLYVTKAPWYFSDKEKVKDFLSSKEVLEVGFKDLFLESLGYDVITTKLVYIDEYPFLEVYCNTQFKTQKQTNWLTVKEGVMINLLGTTINNNYWKMYSFFKKLKESVKIDASKKNQNNTKTKIDVPNVKNMQVLINLKIPIRLIL